jgi:predicted dehydrogenase
MRRDAGKAADFARRHGVARSYGEAEALIGDPDVNIVYVATPPGSHLEYALRVAAAGKACYVEKPMARNHAECRRMVEAFERAGLPLYVAYYRRGMGRFLKTKELLAGGAIGRLTSVTYRMLRPGHRQGHGWRVQPAESGGGLFLDVGSHTLDILDFVLGPLEDVRGVARNVSGVHAQVEDTVAMSFVAGGAPGTAGWNFAADGSQDLIEFYGTDGHLALSTFGHEPLRLTRGGEVEEFPFPAPAHVHQGLVETIAAELTTGEIACPSTGVTAARTTKVMDDVLTSFYGDRDREFWRK